MTILRLFLKTLTVLIYVSFAAVVLYFPSAELISYLGRETRLFLFTSHLAIDDLLLPCLLLAIIYALVMAARRKVEQPGDHRKDLKAQ